MIDGAEVPPEGADDGPGRPRGLVHPGHGGHVHEAEQAGEHANEEGDQVAAEQGESGSEVRVWVVGATDSTLTTFSCRAGTLIA